MKQLCAEVVKSLVGSDINVNKDFKKMINGNNFKLFLYLFSMNKLKNQLKTWVIHLICLVLACTIP